MVRNKNLQKSNNPELNIFNLLSDNIEYKNEYNSFGCNGGANL